MLKSDVKMSEQIEDPVPEENDKNSVKHFMETDLDNKEIKEEPFFDSEFQNLYGNEINELIKPEEINVKTEPLETITRCLNVKDESREHEVKEEYIYDSSGECMEIKTENVTDETNYTTTSEDIKSEEIDIKYDCIDSFSVSSIRYAAILERNSNKNAEMCRQQNVNFLDATDVDRYSSSKFMHTCNMCDYSSNNKRNLTRHMSTHKKSKTKKVLIYKCTVCGASSKYKHSSERHMLTHLGPSEKTLYKCRWCDFTTYRKDYLQNHLFIHKDISKADVKLYKCDQCEYTSTNKSRMKYHGLVHRNSTETTMHRCPTCNFESKYKRNLNKHLEIHTDPVEREKNLAMHTCDVCSFKTRRKYDLNKHMMVHKDPSEVQMYKCTACDYQTKYKGSLNYHRLRHLEPSEKKMYKCDLCDYSGHSKDLIRKHHRSVHKSEMDMHATNVTITKLKRSLEEHRSVHDIVSK